jgi:hypothetical protein
MGVACWGEAARGLDHTQSDIVCHQVEVRVVVHDLALIFPHLVETRLPSDLTIERTKLLLAAYLDKQAEAGLDRGFLRSASTGAKSA